MWPGCCRRSVSSGSGSAVFELSTGFAFSSPVTVAAGVQYGFAERKSLSCQGVVTGRKSGVSVGLSLCGV